MRIALLEDDHDQANLISHWLETDGHECRHFGDGDSFMEGVGKEAFDLLILDWLLPDTSGVQVLEWARAEIDWPIPVLFITRRDSEQDIVLALEKGADDYMTKPVKQFEMLARVKALNRRAAPQDRRREVHNFGPYTVDTASRTITREEKRVDLTQKEFELSLFLFQNMGRVLSRSHILEHVWGRSGELNTRTVDTHVSRIRKKLSLLPECGWRLSAIYQYGYRLERLEPEEA